MNITIKLENEFTLARGEVKAFPITVCSDEDLDIMLRFEGIGNALCLYCEGNDYRGRHFKKNAHLDAGKEKRLWCLIPIGKYEAAGTRLGKVIVISNEEEIASASITLNVTRSVVGDEQFEDPKNLKRLAWLNSKYAIDGTVTHPYTPVKTDGKTVSVLGRSITFSDCGLPASVKSYFTEDIRMSDTALEILSAPFRFTACGEAFENESFEISSCDEGADIHSVNNNGHFRMDVQSRVEFDGYADFKITLTALQDADISDIAMDVPVAPECTKYFMGLGKEGGYFDRDIKFKWSSERHQDNFWVGAVNGGIRVKLTGENYIKPLVNIYYSQKPMAVPESWGNGDRGGINFDSEGSVFNIYSGERRVKAGDVLHYDFSLIVTPLKPIDLEASLATRIFHRPPEAKIDIENKRGAHIVNIHHGNDLNPFINYPFFENEALRKFITDAHDDGLLVKIYYTIRELTIMTPEFSALRDFDYEIFERAGELSSSILWQGDAKKWIKENIGDDIIPAWRQNLYGDKYKGSVDASIITNGQSRLCNFYIEGLRYLVEHMAIDGLYIDDLAYDRHTMKRVRRTIDKRPEAYIDFHTWNHYTERAAFSNSINLYMELLPYIDKAWIGEGFDYDMPEDHWLVAISGIPFGLMSEMMCEGQPWRGLTLGMTTRLGWVPEADPTNIWELFDEYEIGKTQLLGFWDKRNTLRTSNPAIVPTVYKGKDRTFVHLANFSNEEQTFELTVDGATDFTLKAPAVRDLQDAGEYGSRMTIAPGRCIFAEIK